MRLSPAGRSALRRIGAPRAWREEDHPRHPKGSGDSSGEFVSTQGVAPAPTAEAAALFAKLKAQGMTHRQMIAEATRQGISSPKSELDKWLWDERKRKGGGKVLKLTDRIIVRKSKISSTKDTGRDVLAFAAAVRQRLPGADSTQIAIIVGDRLRVLEADLTRQPQLQQKHGMYGVESMHMVHLGPIELHYTAGLNDVRAKAARLIADYAGIPDEVSSSTNRILISNSKNSGDPHWEKVYGQAGFTAGATGGDFDVVFYKGVTPERMRHTLVHEMGHNVATKIYGSTDPGPSSPIGKLYDKWKESGVSINQAVMDRTMPTSYSRHNRDETFAEAIAERYGNGVGNNRLGHTFTKAVAETLDAPILGGNPHGGRWSHKLRRWINP